MHSFKGDQTVVETIHGVDVYYQASAEHCLYEKAKVMDRIAAGFIDITIIFSISELMTSLAFRALYLLHLEGLSNYPIEDLFFMITYILYHVLQVLSSGQTIGKKALGIKVILSKDMGKHSWLESVLNREIFGKILFFILFPIPLLLWLFDGGRKSIQDYLGRTEVVSFEE